MSRSYESIEGDIAKAREDLSSTLDEIFNRVSPSNLADQGKATVTKTFSNPKVLAGVGAAVAVVLGGVAFKVTRDRKKQRRLEEYLALRK